MKDPNSNDRSCWIWIKRYQVSQSVLAGLFFAVSIEFSMFAKN
jgi:hypothetical protein